MRFYTLTIVIGFVLTGLATAGDVTAPTAELLSAQSTQQPTIANGSRTRSTSYRGSGRRAIMAIPALTPVQTT